MGISTHTIPMFESLKIWEWYEKLTIRGSHYPGSPESTLNNFRSSLQSIPVRRYFPEIFDILGANCRGWCLWWLPSMWFLFHTNSMHSFAFAFHQKSNIKHHLFPLFHLFCHSASICYSRILQVRHDKTTGFHSSSLGPQGPLVSPQALEFFLVDLLFGDNDKGRVNAISQQVFIL